VGEHVDLLAQAVGDQRGAPAELDVVDVLGPELDLVGEQAERDAAVELGDDEGCAEGGAPEDGAGREPAAAPTAELSLKVSSACMVGYLAMIAEVADA